MRMRWSVLGGLVTALGVSACQRESTPQQRLEEARQQLEETRREAHAQMEESRQRAAQRRAEIDQKLAEQLEAQQQRIAQAERQWQLEQRQAAEQLQQRTGATVTTLDGAGAVQGRIVSTEPGSFVVRDEHGRTYTLGTDARTQVTQNEQPVNLNMYAQGTEVRASFIVQDDEQFIAREVEILPAPAPAPAR